jgi:hypothetical protein
MAQRKQTRARCTYCGHETNKAGMTRHLASCPQRKSIIAAADSKSGKPETLYHLRVQDAYGGLYWMDLEMRGAAPMEEMDRYLRAIWLECCGHMSRFSYGGWGTDEIGMSRKADRVFAPDVEITHIYDFGTSSETRIKVVAIRTGKATTPHPIALMARNLMPEAECIECGEPAKWYCEECAIKDESPGTLCDEHVEAHPHDRYGEPIEIVNSPRLGMCGYTGPSDPPY